MSENSIFDLVYFISRILTVLLLFACLQKVSWWGHPLYHDRRGPPVVPYLVPWFGSTFAFYSDFVAFIRDWSNHFKSGIFSCYLHGIPTIVVTDPFAAQILVTGRIHQLRWSDILIAMLHKGLGFNETGSRILAEGSELRMVYHKHLMNHENMEKEVMKFQKVMFTHTLPTLLPSSYGMFEKECPNGCREWVQLGILQFFGQLIFMTTSTWLFGSSSFSTPENFETLLKFDDGFLRILRTPSFLLPFYREWRNAREKLMSGLKVVLSESLPSDQNKPNGIGQLIIDIENLALKNGILPSLDQRARLVFSVLFAGTANAIPTAFWVIYHILADQEAYQAVQEEVFAIRDDKLKRKKQISSMSSSSEGKHFSLFDLDKMVKLESVVTEALRFRSTPRVLRRRVATEDFELKLPIHGKNRQFNVKKGSLILTCPSLVHFDDEIFENAQTFNWKRFLPQKNGEPLVFKKNGTPLRNPVQAFGGGTTLCPGRNFARAELKLIVATFIIDHEMRFAGQGTPSSPDYLNPACNFGMPAHDVLIEVRKRDN